MNLFHLLIIPVLLYLVWISWGSLPRLIFALDPSRLRYQFVDALDEERATTTVNRFSEIVGQLQQLGFRRLGLKTEKLPLWSSTIYEISLASPDHHAFASLIKDPKRCVYYFYTPFTNGAILLTAGSGAAFPAIQQEDCVQQVSVYDSPELVLAAHQEQLQHFTATGLVPCSSYTQESRLDATRQYYAAPAIRRIARQRGIFELVALLFPISLVVILAFLGSRG